MTVTLRLDGSKELQAALRRASGEVREAASKAVIGTALELQGNIKTSIARGPASGRTYQKYNPRRTHTASAPGQPPMSDTGRLVNSIEFDKIGDLTATVGSKLTYALYLEYGTSRMAARPFFRPAVEEIRPIFMKRIEKALGDELR